MPTAVAPPQSPPSDDLSLAQRFAAPFLRLPVEERPAAIEAALAELTDDEARYLETWEAQRRPSQVIDPTNDAVLVGLLGGRGSGKTRAGAEGVCDRIEADMLHEGALVGRTPDDIRKVMIEGDSGLIQCAEARGIRIIHQPSKKRLIVVGGGRLSTYSAYEPKELRGPNLDTAWADEFAAWPPIMDEVGNTAFSNLMGALRAGRHPLGIFTTTPRAVPAVRKMIENESGLWRVARMSMRANQAHLAPNFVATIRALFAGTRLEAQEFEGIYIEDAEGALWSSESLELGRIECDHSGLATTADIALAFAAAEAHSGGPLPWLFLAVDPSASEKGTGDECGMVLGGIGLDHQLYVLADLSGALGARQWAERLVWACHTYGAKPVVEGNLAQGLAAETIASVDPRLRIEWVRAQDGKRARAEPVSVLFEGHAVLAHMVGRHPRLEQELTGWDSRQTWSPNRLDALAWLGHKALEHLFVADAGWTAGASRVTFPT